MSKLVWLSLGAVLTICAARAGAQLSPLDAAASLVPGRLDGDWTHASTSGKLGIDKISIYGNDIRPFGSCHLTDCDWGRLRAQNFASHVDSRDTLALLADYDTGFSRTIIAISLESEGRLRVQTFTHFTDASRRADYSSIEYFVRQ